MPALLGALSGTGSGEGPTNQTATIDGEEREIEDMYAVEELPTDILIDTVNINLNIPPNAIVMSYDVNVAVIVNNEITYTKSALPGVLSDVFEATLIAGNMVITNFSLFRGFKCYVTYRIAKLIT